MPLLRFSPRCRFSRVFSPLFATWCRYAFVKDASSPLRYWAAEPHLLDFRHVTRATMISYALSDYVIAEPPAAAYADSWCWHAAEPCRYAIACFADADAASRFWCHAIFAAADYADADADAAASRRACRQDTLFSPLYFQRFDITLSPLAPRYGRHWDVFIDAAMPDADYFRFIVDAFPPDTIFIDYAAAIADAAIIRHADYFHYFLLRHYMMLLIWCWCHSSLFTYSFIDYFATLLVISGASAPLSLFLRRRCCCRLMLYFWCCHWLFPDADFHYFSLMPLHCSMPWCFYFSFTPFSYYYFMFSIIFCRHATAPLITLLLCLVTRQRCYADAIVATLLLRFASYYAMLMLLRCFHYAVYLFHFDTPVYFCSLYAPCCIIFRFRWYYAAEWRDTLYDTTAAAAFQLPFRHYAMPPFSMMATFRWCHAAMPRAITRYFIDAFIAIICRADMPLWYLLIISIFHYAHFTIVTLRHLCCHYRHYWSLRHGFLRGHCQRHYFYCRFFISWSSSLPPRHLLTRFSDISLIITSISSMSSSSWDAIDYAITLIDAIIIVTPPLPSFFFSFTP